jgi:hypothetical protein
VKLVVVFLCACVRAVRVCARVKIMGLVGIDTPHGTKDNKNLLIGGHPNQLLGI